MTASDHERPLDTLRMASTATGPGWEITPERMPVTRDPWRWIVDAHPDEGRRYIVEALVRSIWPIISTARVPSSVAVIS